MLWLVTSWENSKLARLEIPFFGNKLPEVPVLRASDYFLAGLEMMVLTEMTPRIKKDALIMLAFAESVSRNSS